jgi:hypothetical protein
MMSQFYPLLPRLTALFYLPVYLPFDINNRNAFHEDDLREEMAQQAPPRDALQIFGITSSVEPGQWP